MGSILFRALTSLTEVLFEVRSSPQRLSKYKLLMDFISLHSISVWVLLSTGEIITRGTFETPKYPRRPRDQYKAPNSKYVGSECSAPPPNRGKPAPLHPTYLKKIKKMIKNLQHGNLPGEDSNNKYICSSKKQDYYSLHVHLHSVCSIFQRMLCLYLFFSHLSPSHLFYELHQVSVTACHFSS